MPSPPLAELPFTCRLALVRSGMGGEVEVAAMPDGKVRGGFSGLCFLWMWKDMCTQGHLQSCAEWTVLG